MFLGLLTDGATANFPDLETLYDGDFLPLKLPPIAGALSGHVFLLYAWVFVTEYLATPSAPHCNTRRTKLLWGLTLTPVLQYVTTALIWGLTPHVISRGSREEVEAGYPMGAIKYLHKQHKLKELEVNSTATVATSHADSQYARLVALFT